MNGWIKIHRTMLQWEHFNEPSVVTVFLALLLNADRDGKTDISLSGLTSATGLTTNTVRCALAKLVNSGEITRDFVKGQKTTTSIANWSKYQVYQKSTHQDKAGVAKNDTPPCQKLIDPISKIDTPTHTYINKNNKKDNKNNCVVDAHARTHEEFIENALTDMAVERGCMAMKITREEYRQLLTDVINDWEFRQLPDNEWTLTHLLAQMRIKHNIINRNNGNNQQSGQPSDARAKLDNDAVKAMAALGAEIGKPQVVPF